MPSQQDHESLARRHGQHEIQAHLLGLPTASSRQDFLRGAPKHLAAQLLPLGMMLFLSMHYDGLNRGCGISLISQARLVLCTDHVATSCTN